MGTERQSKQAPVERHARSMPAPRQAAQQPFGYRLLELQRTIGNRATTALLQRVDGDAPAAGAQAPAGHVAAASEDFYTVSGATLDDITGQLAHFDGHGAQTSMHLGITGQLQVQRAEDGTRRVDVPWAINSITVGLPQWSDRGAACEEAQTEWDRFMTQVRLHEQTAHVDQAAPFLAAIPAADRVVTGADLEELQANLEAKQAEIAARLQAIHDGCDHGASVDAILHPDAGRCEVEEEEEEASGT